MARPICLRLLEHFIRAAASRTFCTAGSSSPIRMAMMAITTSNSISVKPDRLRQRKDFMRHLHEIRACGIQMEYRMSQIPTPGRVRLRRETDDTDQSSFMHPFQTGGGLL